MSRALSPKRPTLPGRLANHSNRIRHLEVTRNPPVPAGFSQSMYSRATPLGLNVSGISNWGSDSSPVWLVYDTIGVGWYGPSMKFGKGRYVFTQYADAAVFPGTIAAGHVIAVTTRAHIETTTTNNFTSTAIAIADGSNTLNKVPGCSSSVDGLILSSGFSVGSWGVFLTFFNEFYDITAGVALNPSGVTFTNAVCEVVKLP